MTFARRPYPKPPRAPLVPIPRDKEQRREWEAEAGQRTRETINRMGLWPQGLEQWPNAAANRTAAGGSG